jgi:hypothetical protein
MTGKSISFRYILQMASHSVVTTFSGATQLAQIYEDNIKGSKLNDIRFSRLLWSGGRRKQQKVIKQCS